MGYDYSVHVTPMDQEEIGLRTYIPRIATLYERMFQITLNGTVLVNFVPTLDRDMFGWPPIFPNRLYSGDVETQDEMRLFWAITPNTYTVTPDPERAGQEEVVPELQPPPDHQPIDGNRAAILFYMRPEEYIVFEGELKRFGWELMGLNAFQRVSRMQRFRFIRFIQEHIIPSANFSEVDRSAINSAPEPTK